MKKLIFSAVLLAVTVGVFAQIPSADKVKGRTIAKKGFALKAPAKTIFENNNVELSDLSQYGDEVEILKEDFSLVNTGAVDAPDAETQMWLSQEEQPYVYLNMKEGYTQGDYQWGCQSVYPAGGMLAFNVNNDGGGRINTPMLDLTANDGISILHFRARTVSGTLKSLSIDGAETNGMGPTWRFLQSYYNQEVTEEWKDYEYVFTNCGPSTIFNIAYNDKNGIVMLIDDIRLCQLNAYVGIPNVKEYSNYTGSSFDANWDAVEGADSYLLNVNLVDEYTFQPLPFKQDIPVTGTTYTVEGIESGATYEYNVRAVKGDKTSITSNTVQVFDLAAPEMLDCAAPVEGKYEARWTEVPTAEVYNYWAFNERVAETDGEFAVTDENFENVTLSDGTAPDADINDPSFNVYDDTYLVGVDQAGWHGQNYMPYMGGFVAVDGYHYLYNGENAAIISPEMDFSKDGGKITVSVKLLGEVATFWDTNNVQHSGPTQAAIALFNYDEAKGEFLQKMMVYADGKSSYNQVVTDDWGSYTVTLTGATSRSKVGIFAVRYPGNLYIDDLKITQNYKAGESLIEPFLYRRYYNDGIVIDVTMPKRVAGDAIYHKVSAVKSNPVTKEIKESAFSDTKQVTEANAIHSLNFSENDVTINGNELNISNPYGKAVQVYTIDGKLISTGNSCNTTLSLGAKGTYIVKIGSETRKVLY